MPVAARPPAIIKNQQRLADGADPEIAQTFDQLIDTVQLQWDQLLSDNGGIAPTSGTKVKITFRLKSDGTVSQIISMDGDAGKLGETYCASAITIPGAPPNGFGKWTDDMVAMMGDHQDLTFAFYYY